MSALLLHADAIGSFQIHSEPVVSIGSTMHAIRCDIPLLADAATVTAIIRRCDHDYFISTQLPIHVNGVATTGTLLSDGDKIALGPRCRFVFRRPNIASGTALLELKASRLARGDIRRIVLLDRELVVGPGPVAHVRCDDLPGETVLQVGQSSITVLLPSEVQIGSRRVCRALTAHIGEFVHIGSLRFVFVHA